jgi:hypothetical protein
MPYIPHLLCSVDSILAGWRLSHNYSSWSHPLTIVCQIVTSVHHWLVLIAHRPTHNLFVYLTSISQSESESELLCDSQFTTNQFVLAPSPMRLMIRFFFQLNCYGYISYVTASLTRGMGLSFMNVLDLCQVYVLHIEQVIENSCCWTSLLSVQALKADHAYLILCYSGSLVT